MGGSRYGHEKKYGHEAVVFGLGTGLISPTLLAWGVDLSEPARRGRAMATLYIALEIGIGMGAIFSAWIYANMIT